MILVDVDRVAASRPGKPLFADVSFTMATGDRLGVVGINGCGKSTLLRIVAGDAEPEAGEVRRGSGARIATLDQQALLPVGPVRDAVGAGWQGEATLDRLGMGELLDADTATLSGGQAKRVALARALVAAADLLILDEPTNHLDLDGIDWLEDHLAGFRGGLVLVTHDRHLLDAVCTRVLELDRGHGYLHDAGGAAQGGGAYQAYLDGRARREEQAAAEEATRRVLARRELAWLRRGAPARTRKAKARLDSAARIVSGGPEAPARAGELDLSRAGPSVGGDDGGGPGERGWGAAGVAKRYPGTPRLGDKVLEAVDLGHRWPDPDDPTGGEPGPWLFRHLDLLLDNRERLGIVGPNGGGKSTLLHVLAGRIEPTEGRVETGPTVRLGLYDQQGEDLDPAQRVRDAVAGPTRSPDHTDAALLERFWFATDTQFAPIGLLSGGERRRLQLLLVLARKPNVLLLDEPTNDLDVDTLRVLEDYLDDWPGALVVVSHDRAFLERTVEDVLVLDGAGDADGATAGRRPGGYEAFLAERRAGRRGRKAGAVGGGRPPGPAGAGERPTDGGGGTSGAEQGTGVADRPAGRSPSTLRHLLKDSEKELARAERRHDDLAAELAAASGSADHERLAELGSALAEAAAERDAAEERWLEVAAELEDAQAARRAR